MMLFRKALTRKSIVVASVLGLGALSLPAIAQNLSSPAPGAIELAQAPAPNIVGVAQNNPDFSTLVKAVQAAGLADTLAGNGPFTVFAPTNEAFNKLPPGTLDTLLKPENRDLLTDVLKYHVVPGRVPSDDLKNGGLDTLNGGVAVRKTPDRVIVNNANVVAPNVPASNGIVHGIDRVLIPMAVRDRLAQRTPVPGLW
ncbi:fasciclin domain-containing protein [Oscillatoria sp. FACHB-1406]|uniref:fasciclin domain-containing protein n=1 Tax=Oscillatoria sp. FACHB-1406 TaxID=2692846 RepID=UPI0016888734|nr:fasciclin domain-containing protein [Oscillatoria sp. FACHB-1406]MBD2576525.1 fasciclin domain-containing protein [Oscillatoria sp. FACHB-1406]